MLDKNILWGVSFNRRPWFCEKEASSSSRFWRETLPSRSICDSIHQMNNLTSFFACLIQIQAMNTILNEKFAFGRASSHRISSSGSYLIDVRANRARLESPRVSADRILTSSCLRRWQRIGTSIVEGAYVLEVSPQLPGQQRIFWNFWALTLS